MSMYIFWENSRIDAMQKKIGYLYNLRNLKERTKKSVEMCNEPNIINKINN